MKFNLKILGIWIGVIIVCSTPIFYDNDKIMNYIIGGYALIFMLLIIYLFLLTVFDIDILNKLTNTKK